MLEKDEACRRCTQKGIECVRRKKDLQSLLDEQNDWRTDMEKEMQALRFSLDQVSTTLSQLVRQQTVHQEPPRKRPAVQATNQQNAADDSELASEGLLGLAGQWTATDQIPSSRHGHNIIPALRPGSDMNKGDSLAESNILDSPEHSESPGLMSSSIRGDVLQQDFITLDEAVELFYLYFRILDPHICHLIGTIHGIQDLPEKVDSYEGSANSPLRRMILLAIEKMRSSSKLLFVSILCVSALHMKQTSNNHHLFPSLYREFIRLAAIQAFSRHQTLDDIRALVIGSFWLNDVSWTLVGTAVRIVTERHMHESYAHWVPSAPLLRRKRQDQSLPSGRSVSDTAGHSPNKTDSPLRIAYEEARLYYLIYIADHQSSIPYRRPPMTRQHEVIRRAVEWLNNCTWAENRSDTRLVALVKMWEILHDAIDEIGSDLHASLDELGLAFHARFQGQIEAWYQTWSREFSVVDIFEKNDINRQRLYAELFLHSMAFRTDRNALPVFFSAQVMKEMMGESNSSVNHACFQADRRRVIAENAVESAHRILEVLAADVAHLSVLIGSTSYSHTMTTFAIVLLVKALRQFGNEENSHHLRGADLRSVLRSVDPALRALVTGAQCVAKENMLVNIIAGAKQSIEQIRAAYTSIHREPYFSTPQYQSKMEQSQKQSSFGPTSRPKTPHAIQTQHFPTWTPPVRASPINVNAFDASNLEQQQFRQEELGGINSLESFDLLSGQIPLSGIDLFEDTTLGAGVEVSDLSSMFTAAMSP